MIINHSTLQFVGNVWNRLSATKQRVSTRSVTRNDFSAHLQTLSQRKIQIQIPWILSFPPLGKFAHVTDACWLHRQQREPLSAHTSRATTIKSNEERLKSTSHKHTHTQVHTRVDEHAQSIRAHALQYHRQQRYHTDFTSLCQRPIDVPPAHGCACSSNGCL